MHHIMISQGSQEDNNRWPLIGTDISTRYFSILKLPVMHVHDHDLEGIIASIKQGYR